MDAMQLLRTRASNGKLGEPAPDDATLDSILQAALRAPDHGALRPWKILVVRGEARARLGELCAEGLRARQPAADAEVLERERKKPLRAPLLLVVAATPRESPKAPEIEQILSAGTLAHGLLLGFHAHGFGAIWRTGDGAYDPVVKAGLGLAPNDHVVAFLYVGTPTVAAPELRRPVLADHVREWEGPPASLSVAPRHLGTLATLDVPADWTLRASPAGFFLDDAAGAAQLVVHPDVTEGGRFDRLPRAEGDEERALQSGARLLRNAKIVAVDLPLGDGTSLVCVAEPTHAAICATLRRR